MYDILPINKNTSSACARREGEVWVQNTKAKFEGALYAKNEHGNEILAILEFHTMFVFFFGGVTNLNSFLI